jgi:glycosyltransferase involved in cell wall biosynthesis
VLLYLKGVERHEVDNQVFDYFGKLPSVVYRDSDFTEKRRDCWSVLRREKAKTVVFCVYHVDYLKWMYLYACLAFYCSHGEAYILDKAGNRIKINVWYLITRLPLVLVSLLIQLFSLLICRCIPFEMLCRHTINPILKPATKKMVYVRANDTYNLRSGGALGHTVGLIRGFQQSGIDVNFLAIDDIVDLREVNKLIVPPIKLLHIVDLFSRFLYNAKMLTHALPFFQTKQFDFIYQRASRENFVGLILRKVCKVPLVLEFNSFIEWELDGAASPVHRLFSKPAVAIEKLNLDFSDLIVTVSDPLKELLLKSGIDANKVVVCPNAVDVETFHDDKEAARQTRERLQISPDSIVIGFSGTFGFWHGIEVLTSTIRRLSSKYPEARFLLIGDGARRDFAQRQLENVRNAIFLGNIPYAEVNSYLAACDVLVSPHAKPLSGKFIGSPTKLYEYMACGKIVVASDLDQIAEVVSPCLKINPRGSRSTISRSEGDEVGITVEPGSEAELLCALDQVIADIDMFRYLGGNARRKVVHHHSWTMTAARIRESLDRVLAQ